MGETARLRSALDAASVRWRDFTHGGTLRTCYMGELGMVLAVCGPETPGHESGLLEAWWPHVVGARRRMTAEQVLEAFPPKGRHAMGGPR